MNEVQIADIEVQPANNEVQPASYPHETGPNEVQAAVSEVQTANIEEETAANEVQIAVMERQIAVYGCQAAAASPRAAARSGVFSERRSREERGGQRSAAYGGEPRAAACPGALRGLDAAGSRLRGAATTLGLAVNANGGHHHDVGYLSSLPFAARITRWVATGVPRILVSTVTKP